MAEDWRVTIELDGEDDAKGVLRILHGRDVQDALSSRIAVSSDGPNVFLYADTRGAAEAGEKTLRDVLAEEGLRGEPKLTRWHPVEERWEDPGVVLSPAVERERIEQEETEESREEGVAEWEVRVELQSHADAEQLANQLETEGATVTQRWKYLLVSANDKDDAEALAHRIQAEAPAGATVHVEPGAGLAWEFLPRNPFAIFGGLGS